MPASISLHNVSWFTPDGNQLFNNLDLNFGPERTGIVGRNGSGKSTLVHLIAGEALPASGHISISGTLGLMRQDPLDMGDETVASLLGVKNVLDLIDRAARGEASVGDLAEVDWEMPVRIEAALARCGLSVDPRTPLDRLSGGERTKAALAGLILASPDFLLMDEPTNNLDQQAKRAVIDLIGAWKGGAIIVSHDRELLENMDAIVELSSLGAARYGGNYTAFRTLKLNELAAAEHNLAHAQIMRAETSRRAQEAAERKARKDSVGRKSRVNAGQPKALLDFAKGRAEASGGAGRRLREARRDQAETALVEAREKLEILDPLRMEIAPTRLAAGKIVAKVEHLTGGHDPKAPIIRDLSFALSGAERLAITGRNGCGKTTLIGLMTGKIPMAEGSAHLFVPWVVLDQQIGFLEPARTLRDLFVCMNPGADAQSAHAALARFGFRSADGFRLAGTLSGGERLRAALACLLGGTPPPQLLILDEPTNHLDLEGIEALEAALETYDGAVIAVSHDRFFLRALRPDRTINLKG